MAARSRPQKPIRVKPENEGAFTEQAKRRKMSVQAFARYVLAHKDKFSTTTVKRAVFALNRQQWNHKKK